MMKIRTRSFKKPAMVTLLAALVVGCASTGEQDSSDLYADDAADTSGAVTTGLDDAAVEAENDAIDAAEDAVVLESVFYFDYDQSTLTSSARASLDAQAAALRGGNSTVRLEGHADERGSREYNLALGERRAKSVADYLAIQGVSRARIEVVSYGEERPISLVSDESGYAQNRRVELK